jgi:TPR repeat protein
MDRLAKTGNAQAIYNQGFMSELGQGTAQDSKKALAAYQEASIKVIQSRHIALLKFIWRVS